jgi:hypothetical protein
MADLSFDDLIPSSAPPAQTTGTGLSFNDLVPPPQPWYSKLGGAADDIARLVANGATLGYADKLAGYMGGEGVAAERAKSNDAYRRAGFAGDAAGIMGTLAPLGLATKVGTGVAGVGAKYLVPAAETAVPYVGAGLGGAATGAVEATGHDTDVGTGALIGGVSGVVGQGVGNAITGGAGKVAGWFNKKPPVDVEGIKEAGRKAYQAADEAGVIIKPEGVQRLAGQIKSSLADAGYHPELQPKVATALSELDRISEGNVTLKGLDVLRKIASSAKTDADPSTRKFGGDFVAKIDNYLDNMSLGDVLTGNKTEGVRSLQEARKLWATARKSELVDELVEKATNQAAAAGSGGNIDNAIRQQFKSLLNNPKARRGFSEDEIESIRTIVRGEPVQNAMRLLGKLSPNGNGLMLLGHVVGGSATGGATVPFAAAGAAGKFVADKATPSNVYALARIIAAGGDASKVAMAKNAVQRLSESERESLSRVLTSWGVTEATP